jgi:hypothetical protein
MTRFLASVSVEQKRARTDWSSLKAKWPAQETRLRMIILNKGENMKT